MTNEIKAHFEALGSMATGEDPTTVKKGVTVRLSPETVIKLDVLSHVSGIGSRQDLLVKLITSGLKTASEAFLSVVDDSTRDKYEHHLEHELERSGIDPEQYRAYKRYEEYEEDQQEFTL